MAFRLGGFTLALLATFAFMTIETSLGARHLLQTTAGPNLPTPNLPPLPTFPPLPQPNLPNLPTGPSLPQPTLPTGLALPPLPPLTSLPNFPSIPAIPTTFPSIPFLSPPPSTTSP